MKKFFALALCIALVGFVRAEGFDLSGFSKMIEIRASYGSLPSGVVLTDFQALVRISTDIEGFSYSDFCQENGADLVFLDGDMKVLSHEIDTWNIDGESLVWVKIPAFQRGKKIYMVYGNAAYEPGGSTAETWSGYTGVWHMKEAEGVVEDATGHGLSATPSGARAQYNVGIDDGIVGMARKNGSIGNAEEDKAYLSIPNYDKFALGDTFTASGFFRIDSSGGWYRLFSRRGPGGWGQEVDSGNAEIVYVYGADGSMPTVNVPGLVGGWVYLTFAYSGATCKVYANGALINTLDINPATENGLPLAIGCTPLGNEWALSGDYDEVRLSAGNLSAERIAADYATAVNKDFLAYGVVEDCSIQKVDPSAFSKVLRITASETAIPSGAAVSKFPALVRLSENIEGFRYADFMNNGADLVFADESGRILPCEIDVWNTKGESLVWVKVPLFCNGMFIFAYWGRNEPSIIAPSTTWSEYTGVWHMNESGGNSEIDVSGNGLHATPWESSRIEEMVAKEDGAVGLARVNQMTDEVRNCLSVPSYPAIGDTFTVSGWFFVTAKLGWGRILSRKEKYGDTGWEFSLYDGADKLDVYGSGDKRFDPVVSDLLNSWNYLVLVYKGSEIIVYQNGSKIGSGTINPVEDVENRPLGIGNNSRCGERSFIGSYDEVRLMRGALTAGRIEADYATVMNAAFFAYGSVAAPALDAPVMSEPVLYKTAQDELAVSFVMISGTGSIYVRFVSGEEKIDVPLSDGAVSGPLDFNVTVPFDQLSAERTYSFSAVGVNTSGGEIVVDGAGVFYAGLLQVEKTSDAAEDGPVAGAFTVSRADAHGELNVNYSLGGSAMAGVDYDGAALGTVTIPAGAKSTTVKLVPKVNVANDADTTVDFAFEDGLYYPSGATASMTITNLAPIKWRAFKEFIEFTFPMESLAAGETLENFPVLIRLSEAIDGFKYSAFKLKRGGDMMFTDAARKAIPSEITTWNEEGTSLVWVSVPSLTKGTSIRMYYGNGANPAGVNLAKWPGYSGVWHLEEESGKALDSSANSFHALPMRNARSREEDLRAVADGAVGSARVNQADTTYYDVGTSDETIFSTARRNYLAASSVADHGLGARLSFSGWFRTTGGTEWSETLVAKIVPEYEYGWEVSRKASQGEMDVKLRIKIADGSGEFDIPDMRNEWVHIFVSIDQEETNDDENPFKSVASVYANGEFVGSASGSKLVLENDYPLTFGHTDTLTEGHAYYGQYDELRLKRGAASPAWVKAEYLTVADPSFVKASPSMSVRRGFQIVVR